MTTLKDYKGLDIYAIFPNFNSYSVEERVEIRELLIKEPKHRWAHAKLHAMGMDCDSDLCGFNSTGNGSEINQR